MTVGSVPTICADEDVAPGLVNVLTGLLVPGLTVTSVRSLGHLRWRDDQHILFSQQGGYVFLTHNRVDYELLHDAWTHWRDDGGFAMPSHAGILILRRAEPATSAAAVASLVTNGAPLVDQAYHWTVAEGWMRRIGHAWLPHA